MNLTNKRTLMASTGTQDTEWRERSPRAGRDRRKHRHYSRSGRDSVYSERGDCQGHYDNLQKGWAAAKECDSGIPLK
eukprot:2780561-Amphidinium_carterae.1